MDNKGYFHTKAGQLTLAFLVIIAASVLIMAGLSKDVKALYTTGFMLILIAMLYSPVKMYIFRRK